MGLLVLGDGFEDLAYLKGIFKLCRLWQRRGRSREVKLRMLRVLHMAYLFAFCFRSVDVGRESDSWAFTGICYSGCL